MSRLILGSIPVVGSSVEKQKLNNNKLHNKRHIVHCCINVCQEIYILKYSNRTVTEENFHYSSTWKLT